MLVCATVFVVAAVGAGVLALTGGDDSDSSPESTVADRVFPSIPTEEPAPEPDSQGDASPDPKSDSNGGNGGTEKRSDGSASDGGDGFEDLPQVECPPEYGREQCEQLADAWRARESHPLKEGKCPRDYGREQCELLKQAWAARESHPIETGNGKNPKKVDCPYGREQCLMLWEAWQAATE